MSARRSCLFAIAAILAIPVQAGQAADALKRALPEARLLAPFDVAAQRKRWGKVTPPLAGCPAPPQGPRDLVREDFYTNKSHSVADPAKKRATLDKLAPLWEFTRVVNVMADEFVMSQPADASRAACVLTWLDAWAKADALTGEISTWARYDTLWAAEIGAGMAYLKVRDATRLDSQAKARVENWLVKVARLAVTDNDKFNAGTDQRRQPRSNLSYWTAAGAAVAGIAANDRALYDWSLETVRRGLSFVTPEGAMPAEMSRQARAFVYHIWGLEPLMLVAACARANGGDVLQENEGALPKVVAFMLRARREPQWFEALAGFPQQADSHPERWPRKDSAAALEMFLALKPDPAVEAIVAPLRPVSTKFSGGNFTLLFATPSPRR